MNTMLDTLAATSGQLAKGHRTMALTYTTLTSPVGPISLVADGDFLAGLEFSDKPGRWKALKEHLARHWGEATWTEHADPAGAATRLMRYFAGELGALDEQPVVMKGTPFQLTVWRALRTIPAGATWSYGQLAKHIGDPGASRAVGTANGRNPIALFVPCHRVIAHDGTLGGYGGGLERKRRLLAHEGAWNELGLA